MRMCFWFWWQFKERAGRIRHTALLWHCYKCICGAWNSLLVISYDKQNSSQHNPAARSASDERYFVQQAVFKITAPGFLQQDAHYFEKQAQNQHQKTWFSTLLISVLPLKMPVLPNSAHISFCKCHAQKCNLSLEGPSWIPHKNQIRSKGDDDSNPLSKESAIVDLLEKAEHCSYAQNGESSTLHSHQCTQAFWQRNVPAQPKWRRKRIRIYPFEGCMRLFKLETKMFVRVMLLYAHTDDSKKLFSRPHSRSCVTQLWKGRLTPFQILSSLSAMTSKIVKNADVHSAWAQQIRAEILTNIHPRESAKIYILGWKEFNILIELQDPKGISIVTTLGQEIARKWEIKAHRLNIYY